MIGGGALFPFVPSGTGGGAPGTPRNYASHLEDAQGRMIRVNFNDGTYRTLTYVGTTEVVEGQIEYNSDDTVKADYTIVYGVDGVITGRILN